MNTNRRQAISLALCSAAPSWLGAQTLADERPIPPAQVKYPGEGFAISEPGRYYLPDDFTIHKLWGGGHTGPKGGYVLRLRCGGLEVDLRGHTIDVRFGMAGIGLDANTNRRLSAPPSAYSADNRRVTLRNGTVRLAGGEQTLAGVMFIDQWREPEGMDGAHGQRGSNVWTTPPSPVRYERNDYLFEDLTILADDLALAVEGSHTVVRRCRIDSAGNAALFIAGPDALVEDCDIRLRPLVRGAHSANRPLRAAVVLRDADNAILRNNRIRVDRGGLDSDTRCVLVRDGARGVVVEGNTFINVEGETVTSMEDAQATLRDNHAEHRLLPF
jgi:hypothetical protein